MTTGTIRIARERFGNGIIIEGPADIVGGNQVIVFDDHAATVIDGGAN
ncbi:MAG: hypothetical protein U0U69_07125 [Acidimicrobiia bacterium]